MNEKFPQEAKKIMVKDLGMKQGMRASQQSR